MLHPSSYSHKMIPQQPLQFLPNSQSHAAVQSGQQYYMPHVSQTQQYPVLSFENGFYPGTSPEYITGYSPQAPPLSPHAEAYYPAQAQYQHSGFPHMMHFAPYQQAPPPQHQAPPRPYRKERKQIRIRDPNQGGRDVTEEIMARRWTVSQPHYAVDVAGFVQCNGASISQAAATPVMQLDDCMWAGWLMAYPAWTPPPQFIPTPYAHSSESSCTSSTN